MTRPAMASLVPIAMLLSACAQDPPPLVPYPVPVPARSPFIDGDPPVVPWRETLAMDDGSFQRECLAALLKVPEKLGWVFGDTLLTKTKDNALIWRADYTTPRSIDPTRLNRVICSRMRDGNLDVQIATDQKVDRLSIAVKFMNEGS